MGRSIDAILVYGFDLGSPDELLVAEVNEDGYLKTSWYDEEIEEDDSDEAEELVDKFVRRLHDSIAELSDADRAKSREALVKERFGVWFEQYGSGDYIMYLLVAHETTANGGSTEALDPAALAALPDRERWDEKLAHALAVLDLTPTQEKPAWLLASYWG